MADKKQTIHVDAVTRSAHLWFIGWLFTIGFSGLSFWKGLLAVVIWPYYLGSTLGG